MKMNGLAQLGVRLSGMLFVILAAFQLPGLIVALSACIAPGTRHDAGPMLFHYLSTVIMGVSGALLYAFSARLSSMLTRGVEDHDTQVGFTMESLQVWSVSLAGLVISATALPRLGELLAFRVLLKLYGGFSSSDLRDNAEIIARTLQFLIGVVMFFGSAGVVGLRQRFREYAIKKET